MGYLRFRSDGDFNELVDWKNKLQTDNLRKIVRKYGKIGVAALAAATPVDTGLTASSWGYRMRVSKKGIMLCWTNSNRSGEGKNSVMVAAMIQYGHATRNGGYVKGVDYINPTMKPIFESIVESLWKEVDESGTDNS